MAGTGNLYAKKIIEKYYPDLFIGQKYKVKKIYQESSNAHFQIEGSDRRYCIDDFFFFDEKSNPISKKAVMDWRL